MVYSEFSSSDDEAEILDEFEPSSNGVKDQPITKETSVRKVIHKVHVPSKAISRRSTPRNIVKKMRVSRENRLEGESHSNRISTQYTVVHLSNEAKQALISDDNLNNDIKSAALSTPSTTLDDIPKHLKPRRNIPRRPSICDSDDRLGVSPRTLEDRPSVYDKLLSDLTVPPPKLRLVQLYTEAVALYKKHLNYELLPPSNNPTFFTSSPIHIFLAITPPSLIISIIKHTNRYNRLYRDPIKAVTFIEFLQYLTTLIDIRARHTAVATEHFKPKDRPPVMSMTRFDRITSILQFTEYYLYTPQEAPKGYAKKNLEQQVLGCIVDIDEHYRCWIKDLFEDISCMVIDESRLGYKQNAERTANSNPIPSVVPSKPQPVGLQLYTLHEAHTNLLLNFAPTTRDFITKMCQAEEIAENTLQSASIVNYLLQGYSASDIGSPAIVIADGYYGSLQSVDFIKKAGHHAIVKIGRNKSGTPADEISQLPTGYQEYITFKLVPKKSLWFSSAYLTKSGNSRQNTILSTLDWKGVIGRFTSHRRVDQKKVEYSLSQPHSLYKLYANSADILNSYVSHGGVHELIKTKKFKVKLFLYFFSIFITQTRLIYLHLLKAEQSPDPLSKKDTDPVHFYDEFSQSIRKTIYYEHHYVVSTACNVNLDEMRVLAAQKKWFEFSKKLSQMKNAPHLPSTCGPLKSKMKKKHGYSRCFCISCSCQALTSSTVNPCKCCKRKHSSSRLIKLK